jgi:DNA-binding transcriptional LysR family regulator
MKDPALSIHQLRILAAVAEAGSISSAAARLHLTQPTLSIQLKHLSDSVGHRLFEFVGRRLHLTDAGLDVLATARAIDDHLEALAGRLTARRELREGRLRIAAVTTAEFFLPRVLGSFRQRYPAISISLSVLNREAVLQRFTENLDDLYVMTRPPEERSVRIEALAANPLVIVAAPGHPWASRSRIAPRELSAQPFVVRESGSGTRSWGDEWLAARGVRIRAPLQLGSNEAVKQAVRGGFGLAVLSAHSLLLELDAGLVTLLAVAGTPIRSEWHLVSRAGHPLGPAAEVFRREARGEMPEIERAVDAALRRRGRSLRGTRRRVR